MRDPNDVRVGDVFIRQGFEDMGEYIRLKDFESPNGWTWNARHLLTGQEMFIFPWSMIFVRTLVHDDNQ